MYILPLKAQDIIITIDAKKIEATITEVTSQYVSYKKISNPDGPIFILEKSQISSIIYKNGDVEIIHQKQPEEDFISVSNNQMTQSKVVQPTAYSEDNRLIKISNTSFRMIATGKTLEAQETINFLKSNCIEAYNEFLRQDKISSTLSGVGGGTFLIGGIFALSGGIYYGVQKGKDDLTGIKVGGTMLGIGCSLVAISVPFLIVGGIKGRHKIVNAVEMYNSVCSQQHLTENDIQFNLAVSQNSIGITMIF